jgi:hypothetical protein
MINPPTDVTLLSKLVDIMEKISPTYAKAEASLFLSFLGMIECYIVIAKINLTGCHLDKCRQVTGINADLVKRIQDVTNLF